MKRFFTFLFVMMLPLCSLASVTVSVNGSNYLIPQTNERGWGTNVTTWIQNISLYTLQPSGGNFTLTNNVDFGSSFGIKTPYYISKAANPGTLGVLRMGNAENISWRNAGNTANLYLTADTTNALTFNGATLATLTNGSVAGNIDASQVTSGTLASARLGTFDASLIATGTLAQARLGTYLGSIAGTQVNSGTIALAQIGIIPFTNLSGTISIAQAGVLPVSTIATTGTFAVANIPVIDALLPTQSGNSGKYYQTNGATSSWAALGVGAPVISTKTSAFTSTTDDLIIMNASGLTGTLASAATSKIATYVNINATGGTVARAGSDLIYNGQTGGTTAIALPNQYDSVTLQSDASSKWFVTGYNRPPKVTVYTSGTSQTHNVEPGTKYIVVEMVGGGGGGAGTGTTSSPSGANGTSSTFGSLTAGAGNGGSSAVVGGAGGNSLVGSGCDINLAGGLGSAGGSSSGGAVGGNGGNSFFGGGGGGGYTGGPSNGNNGSTNTGGGGGGASADSTHFGGGAGGSGGYCKKTILAPLAVTYTYTVGAGAAGGVGSGGSFATGGNGAVGMIIATEYFQ